MDEFADADRQIGEISTEDILSFLNRVTEGKKQQTRRVRYVHLSAFFNFIRNNLDPEFRNPCDTPAMKRLFRNRVPARWNTIDKDTVDEVIFKTVKPRNRLMLELMARGGMRVGEVLKLTPSDVNERNLTLREPKSGRVEVPCMKPKGRLAPPRRGGTPSEVRRIFDLTRTFICFDSLAHAAATCGLLLAAFGSGDRLHSPEGCRPAERLPEGEIVQIGRQDLPDLL